MWTLRKLLTALLDPINITLIVMVIAFVLLCFHWHRSGLVVMAFGLLGLFILAMPPLSNGLLYGLERNYAPVMQVKKNIHWVVVLGAGMLYDRRLPADMQLSAASVLRLVEAVRIYKQLPQAKLVLSGGKTIDEHQETKLREKVAEMMGVPVADIVMLPPARNTYQEAKFTQKVVADHPFYLVTSASHMRRSMALFKGRGLQPLAAPSNFMVRHGRSRWYARVMPSASNLVKIYIYLYETVGYAWSRLTREI